MLRMTPSGHLDTATAVLEAARELTNTPWREVSGPEALGLVEVVVATQGLLDASLLRVADRIESTSALHGTGWATVKDYLTHLTGGRHGTGGGLVRTMEKLRSLPEIQAALEDGTVTLPQARAIADKVHTLPSKAHGLREKAAARLLEYTTTSGHNASQIDAIFDHVVRELDPDGKHVDVDKQRHRNERAAHHARSLSFAPDRVGGVKITGYGTIEDTELIKAALMPLAAPVTTDPGACGGHHAPTHEALYDDDGVSTSQACLTPGCAHDGRDPRDHGARMFDALLDACDRLRATDTLPRDHGSTPKIVVLIDQQSLRQQVIDAGLARPGHTTTGQSLSAHAIRRLACDAEIIPAALGAQGEVLDVGRTKRLVTPAIWNALITRDQHCAFPTCTRLPLACDAHHIVHWADGGTTSLDNMIMLCRHHHTLVHHTPWIVHINPTTRQPVWTPPPRTHVSDLDGKMTYAPARSPARPNAA